MTKALPRRRTEAPSALDRRLEVRPGSNTPGNQHARREATRQEINEGEAESTRRVVQGEGGRVILHFDGNGKHQAAPALRVLLVAGARGREGERAGSLCGSGAARPCGAWPPCPKESLMPKEGGGLGVLGQRLGMLPQPSWARHLTF